MIVEQPEEFYNISMNTATVALVVVAIVAIGVYLGITNLQQQYAVVPGSSYAGQVVCAPDRTTAAVGQAVKFTASGLPSGALPHWSSDEGRGQASPSGFSIIYSSTGTKTVRLFFAAKSAWNLITCSVRVQ